jgi:uncharacterized RDD family membrane protein YckC
MSDLSNQPTSQGAPPGAGPSHPPSAPQATTDGPSGPRAGFWQRFAAALIDGILLAIVQFIIGAILSDSAGIAALLSIVISYGYYIYFEGGTGQTLGKMALGIRVVDFNTGGSIGYGRALIRQLVKIVSSIPIGLGYFWMLWDKEKQTWHDKAATSVVGPVSAYPVQK